MESLSEPIYLSESSLMLPASLSYSWSSSSLVSSSFYLEYFYIKMINQFLANLTTNLFPNIRSRQIVGFFDKNITINEIIIVTLESDVTKFSTFVHIFSRSFCGLLRSVLATHFICNKWGRFVTETTRDITLTWNMKRSIWKHYAPVTFFDGFFEFAFFFSDFFATDNHFVALDTLSSCRTSFSENSFCFLFFLPFFLSMNIKNNTKQ